MGIMETILPYTVINVMLAVMVVLEKVLLIAIYVQCIIMNIMESAYHHAQIDFMVKSVLFLARVVLIIVNSALMDQRATLVTLVILSMLQIHVVNVMKPVRQAGVEFAVQEIHSKNAKYVLLIIIGMMDYVHHHVQVDFMVILL